MPAFGVGLFGAGAFGAGESLSYSKVTQPITYDHTKVTTDFATQLDFDLSAISDADFWALATSDTAIKLDSLTKSIIHRDKTAKTGIARMVVTPDGSDKTVNVQSNLLTTADSDVLAPVNCVLSVGCHDLTAAGGNLVDESGTYAGVETTVTREQTGKIGYAVSLGSSSAKITLGDVAATNAPTSMMIELLYFMPASVPTEADIFYKVKNVNNQFFMFKYSSSLYLTLRNGAGSQVDLIASNPFTANSWHHVLWIWDSAQSGVEKSKIYVNGSKLTYTGTPISALPDMSGYNFVVGASGVGGANGAKVQEIKVYSSAVAAAKTDAFALTRYNNYFGNIWTLGTLTKWVNDLPKYIGGLYKYSLDALMPFAAWGRGNGTVAIQNGNIPVYSGNGESYTCALLDNGTGEGYIPCLHGCSAYYYASQAGFGITNRYITVSTTELFTMWVDYISPGSGENLNIMGCSDDDNNFLNVFWVGGRWYASYKVGGVEYQSFSTLDSIVNQGDVQRVSLLFVHNGASFELYANGTAITWAAKTVYNGSEKTFSHGFSFGGFRAGNTVPFEMYNCGIYSEALNTDIVSEIAALDPDLGLYGYDDGAGNLELRTSKKQSGQTEAYKNNSFNRPPFQRGQIARRSYR